MIPICSRKHLPIRPTPMRIRMGWVGTLLLVTWAFVLFLIFFAKVRLGMPLPLVYALIFLKLPVIVMAFNFFQTGGRYTRTLFVSDKVDQWSNTALCGYAFYVILG